MAITSGFFNAQKLNDGTYDRVYNAEEMSNYYEGLFTNGVVPNVDDELVVTAGDGLSINVGTGRAIIEGRWLKNSEAYNIELEAGKTYTICVLLYEDINTDESKDRCVAIEARTGTLPAPNIQIASVTIPTDATSVLDSYITNSTSRFLEYALEIKENTELEKQVEENTANIETLQSDVGLTYYQAGDHYEDTISANNSLARRPFGYVSDNPIPPFILIENNSADIRQYIIPKFYAVIDDDNRRCWELTLVNLSDEDITVEYRVFRIEANKLDIILPS